MDTTMKTTTPAYNNEIPQEIMTPDTAETRIGTLRFFDGLPQGDDPESQRQPRFPARRRALADSSFIEFNTELQNHEIRINAVPLWRRGHRREERD
jgi:hypothetical protein